MPVDYSQTWILLIWYRDYGSGLLTDSNAGDIEAIFDGEQMPGTDDRKDWLAIRIPIPSNPDATREAWLSSRFEPGPTPEENVIAQKRRYGVTNWETKFTAEQLAIIRSRNMLPDGTRIGVGGTVVNGIVEGVFTRENVHPK
ncbi:MAG: hypothetical protein NT069_03655 [Planctomycetota bacterium]|nr:hypothetical protein [Planctomycetota bacterium]